MEEISSLIAHPRFCETYAFGTVTRPLARQWRGAAALPGPFLIRPYLNLSRWRFQRVIKEQPTTGTPGGYPRYLGSEGYG